MTDIIKMAEQAGAECSMWVGSNANLQRFADLIRADQQAEIEALRRELQTWKDALWQACGDDEATVDAYVDSQRAARPERA